MVFHLRQLRFEHPYLSAHRPIAIFQGFRLRCQLFLKRSKTGIDVVELLLIGGFGLNQILIALLLALLGSNLLAEGSYLPTDIVTATIRSLKVSQEFLLLQRELHGINIAQLHFGIHVFPFVDIKPHDFPCTLGRNDYFCRFKNAGGVVFAILAMTRKEKDG